MENTRSIPYSVWSPEIKEDEPMERATAEILLTREKLTVQFFYIPNHTTSTLLMKEVARYCGENGISIPEDSVLCEGAKRIKMDTVLLAPPQPSVKLLLRVVPAKCSEKVAEAMTYAEREFRLSPATIAQFRAAGGDKWMDIVSEKQIQIVLDAGLPAEDVSALRNAHKRWPHNPLFREVPIQVSKNYTGPGLPLGSFFDCSFYYEGEGCSSSGSSSGSDSSRVKKIGETSLSELVRASEYTVVLAGSIT